ncbi:hypothetical protein ACOME3_001136 [Neoechinorhynchus agilis]
MEQIDGCVLSAVVDQGQIDGGGKYMNELINACCNFFERFIQTNELNLSLNAYIACAFCNGITICQEKLTRIDQSSLKQLEKDVIGKNLFGVRQSIEEMFDEIENINELRTTSHSCLTLIDRVSKTYMDTLYDPLTAHESINDLYVNVTNRIICSIVNAVDITMDQTTRLTKLINRLQLALEGYPVYLTEKLNAIQFILESCLKDIDDELTTNAHGILRNNEGTRTLSTNELRNMIRATFSNSELRSVVLNKI